MDDGRKSVKDINMDMPVLLQTRILDIINEASEPETKPLLVTEYSSLPLNEAIDYVRYYMKTADEALVIPVHKYAEFYENMSLSFKSDQILLEGLEYRDCGGDLWNIFLLEDGPYFGIEEPMMQIPYSWADEIAYYKTDLNKKTFQTILENQYQGTQVAPIVTMAAIGFMVSWMIAKDLFAPTSIFSEEVNLPPAAVVLEVENYSKVAARMDEYIHKVYTVPSDQDYSFRVMDLSYTDHTGRSHDVFFSLGNTPPMCGIDQPQYNIVPKVINGKQYYIFEKSN